VNTSHSDGGDVATQPEFVLPRTSEAPGEIAVRTERESLSWSELEERGRRVAQGLRSEGLGEHDAWAILARNRIEWAELTLGNARAGTRYVPLNYHLTAVEMADLMTDSSSKLVVVGSDDEAIGREAAAAAGIDRVFVLGPDYESWLAAQSADPLPDCSAGAALQYTGGTTGRSKGVIRSGATVPASELARPFAQWGTMTHMPAGAQMLLVTPAYHALGGAVVMASMSRGNPLFIAERWDPIRTLELIQEHRVAGVPMVPTQFIRLLKLDPEVRNRYDLSSLEWVLHTAAPCPAWAKHAMIEWFGPVIVELYGSSEGVGPVIATSEEWLARPGTVGKATAVLELSILDDDGNELPPGEIGTIHAKRIDGTPSYHGDPEKSAAMMRPDGRFTVGDVGWLDEEGYLFLADRRVDLILIGGSNVYPAEIEAVLTQHPDVTDAAVFGLPHPDMGQEVKAVVQPAEGVELDVAALAEFARARLAPFKVPASIDVDPALPREASGKLKKHQLRERYLEQVGR
jgi:long-chain acyl-CoA synthetase